MEIIPFGEQFPYTNMHDLNLDWIIRMIKELNEKFDEAVSAKIKFADPLQWYITKQYEQLTIVINDETAYLSMQPVPAGTNITNTDYWQPVFDMSLFYQMIEDLDDELTDEIQNLDNELTEEIQHLDEITVKNNLNKEMLYLGDSYSTFYSGLLFTEISANIGIPTNKIHNLAQSGTGFVSDGVKTFLSLVTNYTGDKTAITDILIVGGINDALKSLEDASSDTILSPAITAFVNYCKTNYPNAKIHLAYVGGCVPASTYYTSLHPYKSQQWALWAYTTMAAGLGINVLKTYDTIHLSKLNYSSDGLHPSETGVHAIAEAVVASFNNIMVTNNRPRNVIVISPSGINVSYLSAFFEIINDTVLINIPDFALKITQNSVLSANSFSEILNLNSLSDVTVPTIRGDVYINTIAIMRGFTGSDHKIVPVVFKISDGIVSVKPLSPSGSVYETFTAGSSAYLSFPSVGYINLPLNQIN